MEYAMHERKRTHMKTLLAYFSFGKASGSTLNFSKAIGTTIARQILSSGLQFIALWIITRKLGPEKNGMLATVLLLPQTLYAFLNVGLGAGHIYFVSQGLGSYRQMRRVNWTLAVVLWLATVTLLVISTHRSISTYLPGIEKNLALYASVLFPLMLLAAWSSSLIQGSRNYDEYNKSVLVNPVVFCCAILFLYALDAVTVISVLSSYVISQTASWLWSERKISLLAPLSSNVKGNYTDSLKFGLKAHFSNVITFLNYRIDLYLVSYMVGAAQTGQYSLSIQLAECLWLISFAASVIVFPEAAANNKNPAELHEMTKKIAEAVFKITLAGAVVAAALSPVAIPWIFGSAYDGAVMPFIITLPGIVVWSYMRILSNALAGLGYIRINNWSALICLLVTVVANLLAIPAFGANGAALASTLAYSIATLYTIVMYRRVMRRKIRSL